MRTRKLHLVGMIVAFVIASTCTALAARQLILPSTALARKGQVPVTFNLPQGFTGQATVHWIWTDSLGRTVADETKTYDLTDETKIVFPVDLSKALALQNHLEADVSLNGKDIKGQPYVKQEEATADFVARPPFTGWKDYVIFMWQPYEPNLIPGLKQLGINAGVYSGHDIEPPDYLIDTNTRWYAEGLAADYYGTYHRWHPDRRNNWPFIQMRKLHQERPDSLVAFKRHPSLEDPYWVRAIHDRVVAAAKRLSPYRPYFYSLSDEPGIAVQSTQWDFDMSDQSIVPMRRWLKKQYGSLGALNAEWGTNFTDWNLVMPDTTTQAMARSGDNFSSWGDFKEWMDISFAHSLKMGADAIHGVDPHAYVGIGGAQMPGWGGYDYARLTKVLNVIEPYDIGRSVDVTRSLNPNIVLLATTFAKSPWEKHRIWHELLHGERGIIIWDAKHAYVQPDGQPGPRGAEAGKYYNQLRDGEGALIINSRPVDNLINIDYSQPSMRTEWMLRMRPMGEKWTALAPDYKAADGNNPFARLRISWSDLIEDLGLQTDFISSTQMTEGGLMKRDSHVLILPDSSSLSSAKSDAIRQFIKEGGIAIASGVPGTYDEHSKKLPKSSLDDLFGAPTTQQVNVRSYGKGKAILLKTDIVSYLGQRLQGTAGPTHKLIGDLLRSNGVHPPFTITGADGHSPIGIEMHIYANGGVRIVALESNPQLSVSALGPANFKSNKPFEHPVTVQMHLPRMMYVYDTRARKALGQHKELTLTVDPYEPTILATSDVPLSEMQVSMPDRVKRGSVVNVTVQALPAQAETSVYHVEVQDPAGKKMVFYSGNIIANGGGVRSIPLATNDPTGMWTVTVHDVMSGQTVTRHLDVE